MKLTFTANEIDAWAKEEPRRAQEFLPELIVRLILATSRNITDYNFPIGKGIQFSGYDGVLTSEEQTPYLDFVITGQDIYSADLVASVFRATDQIQSLRNHSTAPSLVFLA